MVYRISQHVDHAFLPETQRCFEELPGEVDVEYTLAGLLFQLWIESSGSGEEGKSDLQHPGSLDEFRC